MKLARYSANDFVGLWVTLIAVAIVGGGVVAFRNRSRPGGHSLSDGTVHRDGGDMHVHLGAGPIPPEFPPVTKLYPGSTMTATVRSSTDVVVSFTTPDSHDAVIAFYRTQEGYETVADVDVDGKHVLRQKHSASGKYVRVVVDLNAHPTEFSLLAPLR